MKALKRFEKVTDIICAFLTGISAVALALLTLDVFVQVVVRSLGFPMSVSVELTQILFPWVCCLAMIPIARRKGNSQLTMFLDKFKGGARHAAEIFMDVIMMYFSFFMIISSAQLAWSLRTDELQLTHCPKLYLYGSMTVGFVGVFIVVLFNLVEYICINLIGVKEEEA